MPILLGPDGPSLGGFVCPAVIAQAELWKMGQLRAGDTVRFRRITNAQATRMERELDAAVTTLSGSLPAFATAARFASRQAPLFSPDAFQTDLAGKPHPQEQPAEPAGLLRSTCSSS